MTKTINLAISSLFSGCLLFGTLAFIAAPSVYGECAYDAKIFTLTYEEACK